METRCSEFPRLPSRRSALPGTTTSSRAPAPLTSSARPRRRKTTTGTSESRVRRRELRRCTSLMLAQRSRPGADSRVGVTPDRHRIYCSKDVAGETAGLLAINLRRSMDGMRGQIHLAARAGQLVVPLGKSSGPFRHRVRTWTGGRGRCLAAATGTGDSTVMPSLSRSGFRLRPGGSEYREVARRRTASEFESPHRAAVAHRGIGEY